MIGWATDVIDAIGLLGVAFLIAVESIFPPIPSELVLLLTGFNVSLGRFDLVSAVVAATVGSLVGAYVLYGLGYWINEERLERFLAWSGRWLGLRRTDVDRAFAWFERHGAAAVFFGRFIPVVRSLVSIPAGAERMPLGRFTLFTVLGSALWNVVFIVVGWRLGDRWKDAEQVTDYMDRAVLVALVLGVVYLVVRNVRRRRSERRQAAAGAATDPAAP